MEDRMTSPSGWLSLERMSKNMGHCLAQVDNVSNIGDATPVESLRTPSYDINIRFFATFWIASWTALFIGFSSIFDPCRCMNFFMKESNGISEVGILAFTTTLSDILAKPVISIMSGNSSSIPTARERESVKSWPIDVAMAYMMKKTAKLHEYWSGKGRKFRPQSTHFMRTILFCYICQSWPAFV